MPIPTDTRNLGRVRALLAKAESSEFAAEADSFTTKAQELMSRHRIEHAMIVDAAEAGTPESWELVIANPYARSKFSLFNGVATANGCQAVFNTYTKVATLVGYAPDQAATEALYTSLLVQGQAELSRQGSVVDGYGVSRTRSYRNAFWAGFAQRIGQRLVAASRATEAEANMASPGVLPVLAKRSEAVDEQVHRLFPHLRQMRSSVTNPAGFYAGEAAAQNAALTAPPQLRS